MKLVVQNIKFSIGEYKDQSGITKKSDSSTVTLVMGATRETALGKTIGDGSATVKFGSHESAKKLADQKFQFPAMCEVELENIAINGKMEQVLVDLKYLYPVQYVEIKQPKAA